MTQVSEAASMSMILGELRGQLRELIHGQNNTAQKVDALANEMAKISNVPAELAELRLRVAALEVDRNKRDGAMGLGTTILKSPVVGWLIAGAAIVLAFFERKNG